MLYKYLANWSIFQASLAWPSTWIIAWCCAYFAFELSMGFEVTSGPPTFLMYLMFMLFLHENLQKLSSRVYCHKTLNFDYNSWGLFSRFQGPVWWLVLSTWQHLESPIRQGPGRVCEGLARRDRGEKICFNYEKQHPRAEVLEWIIKKSELNTSAHHFLLPNCSWHVTWSLMSLLWYVFLIMMQTKIDPFFLKFLCLGILL